MFSINYRKVEGAVYYYNFLLNNSAIQSKFQLTLRTKAFFFQNFVRSNIIKSFFSYRPKCIPFFSVYLQIRACYDSITRGKLQFTTGFQYRVQCDFPQSKKNYLFYLIYEFTWNEKVTMI